jgi:hypothetical protein
LRILIVSVVLGVGLIDLQGFFLQSENDLVDLLSLWLVSPKLFIENFLKTLKGLVIGSSSFVFSDLLPRCFNVGNFTRVEGLDIAIDHEGKSIASDGFSLVEFGTSIAHDTVSESVDSVHKLPS